MNINDDLLGQSPEDYGDFHSPHTLEIYKLYVEMADRISSRRQSANSFFLGINTAIAAFVGYVQLDRQSDDGTPLYWSVAVAGMVLCYFWYRMVRSYKQLNSGKFKVIHEMESKLPLKPYDAEWTALGRGERPDLYLPFTRTEIAVPWVFFGIHLLVLLSTVPWGTMFPSE